MATVGWDAGRRKALTIASGQQTSDVLHLGSAGTYSAYRLGILGPAALTGTITLHVCDTENGTFRTLQSDGVDVTLAAGKAAVLDPVPFPYLRLASSQAEGADRTFSLVAVMGS